MVNSVPKNNYTILQMNLLGTFKHEEAKSAFLRAQEQPRDDRYSYFAEAVAREVDDLCMILKPLIGIHGKHVEMNNDVANDLLAFILKRHWHYRVTCERPWRLTDFLLSEDDIALVDLIQMAVKSTAKKQNEWDYGVRDE